MSQVWSEPPPAAASAQAPAIADAVRILEEDIVLGILHPRERLIEDDLIRRFGFKRHAAREVLAELARLGLVDRRKNVGCEVRAFTPREVAELYQLRELLEGEAARILPCPLPAAALRELTDIQREHDRAVADGDPRAVFHTNQRFHQALFGFCENGVLQKAIQEYARQTHAIRFSSLVDASYRERARQEHWAMIDALRAGQRDELARLCREHLAPSRDAYLAVNRHRYPARAAARPAHA
ncbi:GntR family transcriptional regulator [Bordetella genomosp. 7]|uniref:GntR family transcriptional regulator n=1 Tax=Bordetella genomosp. 7 TaxID=1416805 RepID=A0A261QYV8_9BORD|nr:MULTISPECIES: GntR family transcriptional regulator [Bordetella]OZI17707.1 GntR family transcriptional regulator [Bordetella genomosp. 7]OZI22218.1 GntR family transcriptional regulator [Bordetella genomosp. 7]